MQMSNIMLLMMMVMMMMMIDAAAAVAAADDDDDDKDVGNNYDDHVYIYILIACHNYDNSFSGHMGCGVQIFIAMG